MAELLAGRTLVFLEASCQYEAPRRRVEQAYGLERLHNISGAAEVVGLVTSDCRFHTGLHVPASNYYVEACDPETGRRVEPGERGTLVVSIWGFDNFFLRYDLEDIVVESSGPCPCGQTGPRYTLIGRGADRAVIGGRMILPLDVQLALEEHGAPEFVLSPGETHTLQVRIETEGGGEVMAAALEEQLGCPVEVQEVPVGTFPRSTFKPRRVAS
jgi:phenylacetate-CoA ligase